MKGYFLKMSNKTATVLHPEYVEKFQCDGIKCHAKCCKKWTIAIDDKSYQKYQRIKNSAVRNKILSSMTKTPNVKGHIIKLDSQGACPLICRDSLCYIQRSLGMDYLSDTCQVYPRTLHLLDNMQLRALSMTCPVAAEMALFSPHGMDMHISDISAFAGREDNGWKSLLRTRKPAVSGTGGFAESVLLGSIAILQDASFTREARFILLGMFLDKAEELKGLPDAGVKAAVTAVAYQSGSFRREAAGMLANFTFFPKENENFMNELLSLLAKEQQLGDISGLLKQSDSYNRDYPLWHGLLEHVYGAALDNYWLQEFIYHAYPFYLEGSFLYNYFIYLLSYKVWEIMLYNFRRGTGEVLEKDEFIMLVNSYSSTVDHKAGFLKVVGQKASECEQEPVKAMQMLLRLK